MRHVSYDEPAPRNFSFNSPYGACETCDGLGTTFEVDPELVVPDPDLSLDDGAIAPWRSAHTQYFTRMLEAVAEDHGIDIDAPWAKLTAKQQKVILHGTERQGARSSTRTATAAPAQYTTDVRGRDPVAQAAPRGSRERLRRASSIEGYMREVPCPACGGARLKPSSLAVTIDGTQHLRGLRPVDRRVGQVPRRARARPSATG